MKFSLFKNDKSTYWDEVILAVMVVAALAVGITLIVLRPAFWIVTSHASIIVGVIITLFGVMFFPGLIYRLFTNDIKQDKE